MQKHSRADYLITMQWSTGLAAQNIANQLSHLDEQPAVRFEMFDIRR